MLTFYNNRDSGGDEIQKGQAGEQEVMAADRVIYIVLCQF